MGNYQEYTDYKENRAIGAAGGQVENLLTLDVEVRLVRPGTLEPWGDWMRYYD